MNQKEKEATEASAIAERDESPQDRRVEVKDPILGQGNLSSDGTMVLIRDEGWKEVKLATCSKVEVLGPEDKRRRAAQRKGKRAYEDVVRLSAHSYCAGLWNADTFELYQYAEGLRRGLDQVEQPSTIAMRT